MRRDHLAQALDEEQLEAEARERAARQRADDLKALAQLMSDQKGRRVLWRLFEECGVDAMPEFQANHGAQCFSEGKRRIGCWLRDLARTACSPEQWSKLEQEQNDARSDASRTQLNG